MRTINVREAILTGADSVRATLRLQVGKTLTGTGKEKKIYATFTVDGSPRGLDEAVYLLGEMKEVSVSLPRVEQGMVAFALKPKMSGQRAHCLFVWCGAADLRDDISLDTFKAHLSAMGIKHTDADLTELLPERFINRPTVPSDSPVSA